MKDCVYLCLYFLPILIISATAPPQYTCNNVGSDKVIYDQNCCDHGGVGCNAGGQGECCRFCFAIPTDIRCKASTTPSPPTQPKITVPAHCSSGQRCIPANGLTCQESACTSEETISTPCQCSSNDYCCLHGAAEKGCSGVPWTSLSCSCACRLIPLPIKNCTFEQSMFSPCDASSAPFYCPYTNGCGSKKFPCVDLCYLSQIPPYPPRPVDTGSYQPSSTPIHQNTHCGPGALIPSQKCDAQPNDPKWPHFSKRQEECLNNNWWCPKNPLGWSPSKHQCGAPIFNTKVCPLPTLQAQDCAVSAPYTAPSWAPQPQTQSTYCDTSVDCHNFNDAAHCIGCCQWYNPGLSCSAFWQNGKGAQCKKVSPRFNWIITTCDTNGGIEYGGACKQNPFSAVDVRYMAVYQLTKNAAGKFVWSIVPDSSVNWDGRNDLVDFSSLPTEFTSGPMGGPVNSCSGGGGDWNAAFFPYNVSGVTPPAFMFVLSYARFENAAWFMLNQRILNGGPATPTCNACTNCWGEISGGEIDFLETPNLFPQKFKTETGWKVFRLTSYNAANRCWACSHANHNGTLNIAGCGGEPAKTFYDANADTSQSGSHVWAAVIDARGTTVYKDPDWAGITPTCVAPELENLHPAQPAQKQPCSDPNKTCAMYIPGCVTKMSPAMTQITNGAYSRIPHCWYKDQAVSSTCTENWWNQMMDTGQWIINDPPLL